MDITNEAAVNGALRDIYEKFGRIDYAVNNAGVCEQDGGVAETTTETWKKAIGVNLGKSALLVVIGITSSVLLDSLFFEGFYHFIGHPTRMISVNIDNIGD